MFLHRWILSSRRPLIWTIWPSCMRDGLLGCEGQPVHQVCGPALDWRSTSFQRVSGVRRMPLSQSGDWKREWMRNRPFQTPGQPKGAVVDLVALLQPHSSTICYWAKQCFVGQMVQPGKAMLKGEGERGLEDSSRFTSISCSSVVSEEPLSHLKLVNYCPENLQPQGVFPPPPKESTQQTSRSV